MRIQRSLTIRWEIHAILCMDKLYWLALLPICVLFLICLVENLGDGGIEYFQYHHTGL